MAGPGPLDLCSFEDQKSYWSESDRKGGGENKGYDQWSSFALPPDPLTNTTGPLATPWDFTSPIPHLNNSIALDGKIRRVHQNTSQSDLVAPKIKPNTSNDPISTKICGLNQHLFFAPFFLRTHHNDSARFLSAVIEVKARIRGRSAIRISAQPLACTHCKLWGFNFVWFETWFDCFASGNIFY